MRGKVFFSGFSRYSSIMLICLLVMLLAFGCKQKDESVSRLKDVSVFKLDQPLLQNFVRGQVCQCGEEPDASVKVHAGFKSEKPLYGSVRFAGGFDVQDSGIQYHFAVDESAGTGQGYDRLYFDLNRDLDLTNDTPLVPLKNPPDGAMLSYSSLKQQICFRFLNVNFDFGTDGERALEIMPRLMIYNGGFTQMAFVTTRAHKGRIKIAGQRYDVLLGHNYLISGWFDHPWTALHLIPNGDTFRRPSWSGADRLMAIHKIDQTYYRFSAAPAGNKLLAQPYEGDFGTFEVGPGGRDIRKMAVRGSLFSKDIAVAVGGNLEAGWPRETRLSRVPVGDYLTDSMSISFGRLRIFISNNYHSDGKPRDMDRPKLFAIKIRKDEPCVFDFSNEPEVIFASPGKDHRIKLGEELQVKAVLIDPELDIMIRGLDDTGTEQKQKNVSLDPKVVITRAGGEKVAEGVMPFG